MGERTCRTSVLPCGEIVTEAQADSGKPSTSRKLRQLPNRWAQLACAAARQKIPTIRALESSFMCLISMELWSVSIISSAARGRNSKHKVCYQTHTYKTD